MWTAARPPAVLVLCLVAACARSTAGLPPDPAGLAAGPSSSVSSSASSPPPPIPSPPPPSLTGGKTILWPEQRLSFQVPSRFTCRPERATITCKDAAGWDAGDGGTASCWVSASVNPSTPARMKEALSARRDEASCRPTTPLAIAGMPGIVTDDNCVDKAAGLHCPAWAGFRGEGAERVELLACAWGWAGLSHAEAEAIVRSLKPAP